MRAAEKRALKSLAVGGSPPIASIRRLRSQGLARFVSRGLFVDTWELTERGEKAASELMDRKGLN